MRDALQQRAAEAATELGAATAPQTHDGGAVSALQRLLDLVARAYDQGALRIRLNDGGELRLGHGPVEARIRVCDRKSLLWMLGNLPLRFGEGYMNGVWAPDGCTLRDVLEVATRNLHAAEPRGWKRVLRARLAGLAELNGAGRSRRNAKHHYDFPFRFYQSFLDPDLHYSCAYFREAGMDLAEAQQAKCALIAAKLDLKPGARVLDIGCGWGSLALYLAEHRGARVLGITLSREQLEAANRRALERGLADRVSFQLQDYRQVEDRYDAVVSVGMLEHVGRPYYRTYFSHLRDLLGPDGTALIHTIGRSDPPDVTNAWTRRYIFPGGYMPALSELARPIEDSGLCLTDLEIWRLHYARTLAAWNENFQKHRQRFSASMGGQFCRMWEFYLQGSEAAFRWGGLVVFQLQLAKRLDRLPLTREYLYRR